MLFANVIVPLPLQGEFTYRIPDHYSNQIMIGCRVIVQFGKKKFYTAIIRNIREGEDDRNDTKDIVSVLDDFPILVPNQFQFWEWISNYYMCTMGEVYKAALPSALKLESETIVYKNDLFESNEKLPTNENKIFLELSPSKPLRISELEKITSINNVIPYVKSLADKGAVFLNENITNKYSAKTETAIALAKNYSDEEISELLNDLKRAKKQQHLFLHFLNIRENASSKTNFFILKRSLLKSADCNISSIEALVDKGILRSFPHEISRFNFGSSDLQQTKTLNSFQQQAYESIKQSFTEKDTVLLHGVTSSGKTEIYVQLIKDVLNKGSHVLYLLPEIALTTQITERLKTIFGVKLLVYHSKFNDNERAEVWQSLLNSDESKIILGARSAIFLPFKKLGLVIVDEEHESSYKQQDPAPRYNAKNSAIVLANIYGAKTLLGTATPSIETYYNALAGKFGLVKLDKRYQEIELPEIAIVDTKDLRKRKQMKSILSPPLIEEIKSKISKKEQVILFQNRRGFAPIIECKTCSWTPRCLHCDVSLTFHKGQKVLICHYCGAVYSVPSECTECHTPTLELQGYGTERIEELVSENIPESEILRMDLDTTRSKRAYGKIISDFEENKANVLIGTQMVSKGLDFENVSFVGVLNADNMLNYPDFRAHERAFQMMMQVSGRAGRKNKRGKVLIQTAHPTHPIISFVRNNDYNSFYELQIEERKLFKYPPFFRLIEIVLRGKDEKLVTSMSVDFSNALKKLLHDRVFGPVKPAVSRVQSLHIRKIVLKIENQASPQKVRDSIEYCQKYVLTNSSYKSILIHYDVDPM